MVRGAVKEGRLGGGGGVGRVGWWLAGRLGGGGRLEGRSEGAVKEAVRGSS